MDAVKENPTYLNTCLGCMEDKGGDARCPKCGFIESEAETYELRLKPRSILRNQYLIGRVLGQGGFGITYLGLDLVLNKKVAIKEFMPSSFATRRQNRTTVVPFSRDLEQCFFKGLQSFLSEARSVAKFSRHINIVNVNNYFEENNTGYMVMDYLEGEPVSRLMRERGDRLSLKEAFSIMFPILDALSEVHRTGIYHMDISPQNIVVTTNNIPVLIDFGAAKQVVGEESRSLDVVLKHGYSPLEQYTLTGNIGPWSDVYACGATLYHMITGKLPPPSINRVYSDQLVQPSDVEGLNVTEEVNDAILTALAVRTTDRFQSVDEFKSALQRKGYTGYRKLVESFLKDGRVTLYNRITLDNYIDHHRLDHDEAKSVEDALREELNLPPVDWTLEYRENYEKYSEEHANGIPLSLDEKFQETYVSARRVSHGKALEITGTIGYRRLLGSFLRDKRVSLDNRITLDRYVVDHRMSHAEAKSMEASLRGELNLPPLDWVAEYRENYERVFKEYPQGIPQSFDQKVHETYVGAKRVSHGKAVEIAKSFTVTETEAEPGGKRRMFLAAAAACCIVLAVAVFFVVKPKTAIHTVSPDRTTVSPVASDKYGFINVWSTPPAEIYVNGRFVGLSPQSKIKVPSGEVSIRLLSKKHNIDETYTEFVEPSTSHASN